MAIGDISLTASARANLLSLQSTANLLATTQSHLASGKKVNSALDNASAYFQSQGFLDSANDLSSLKDSLATALQTIKSAADAITSLTNIVTQLQGVVNSALQTTDSGTRATLATQYNGLLSQLDSLANDATFNGTNLINSVTSSLKVIFNTSNTSSLTIAGQNLTSTGLGVASAVGGFASTALAQQTTYTLTRATDGTTVTNGVYSGTLSGLTVTGAAEDTNAGGGSGAVITSTSQNYLDGAQIVSASAAATGTTTYTNLVNAFTNAGITGVTQTTGATTGTNFNSASIVVSGQFTATGGATAKIDITHGLTGSENTLTANAADTTTISVAAGQSIQVIRDAGDASAQTVTTYTNTTSSAITFTLHASADVVQTRGTLAYNGTGASQTAALQASTVVTSDGAIGTGSVSGDAAATFTAKKVSGAVISTVASTTSTNAAVNFALVTAIASALGTAVSTVTDGSAGSTDVGGRTSIAGQFTLFKGGNTHNSIVVKAGDSILVNYSGDQATAGTTRVYTNSTLHDIVIDFGGSVGELDSTNSAIVGTNTYGAGNSTVAYDLAAGTVGTTGVSLTNGETLDGKVLVDSQDIAAGTTVSVSQTKAAAANATKGTTSSTGVAAFDVTGNTISAIGTSGVRGTISGTSAATYSGSDLLVSLTDAVTTLAGSSVQVIADAVTTAQNQLTAAKNTLRSAASGFGNNNTLVQTRSDFTTNLINTLQTASDNLVLADTNEEGANLQALQARNQLGIVSLGISGQLAQSILKLF